MLTLPWIHFSKAFHCVFMHLEFHSFWWLHIWGEVHIALGECQEVGHFLRNFRTVIRRVSETQMPNRGVYLNFDYVLYWRCVKKKTISIGFDWSSVKNTISKFRPIQNRNVSRTPGIFLPPSWKGSVLTKGRADLKEVAFQVYKDMARIYPLSCRSMVYIGQLSFPLREVNIEIRIRESVKVALGLPGV